MIYRPICKPNQLIIGEGEHIAIVTGWTPREKVAKRLDRKDYAVIGNLYNAERGIPFLIRNLLANPQTRYVLALDATKEDVNAGSIDKLANFWWNSLYIDGINDISPDALEILRDNVSLSVCKDINELELLVDCYRNSDLQPYSDPKIFLPPEPEQSETFPGPRYGHRIEGDTIAECWVKLLHRIRKTGTIRPTGYDGQWQELIDLMVVINHDSIHNTSNLPDWFPVCEESIKNYIPQILEDKPYKEGVKYTYGQRIRSWFGQDQIERVIEKLIKEIDSASAVISLWDSGTGNKELLSKFLNTYPRSFLANNAVLRGKRGFGDSDHDYGGSPCLNHLWFRVIDNELSMTATFRSNDMYSAWPLNCYGLLALQEHVANEINSRTNLSLSLAPLITISQSAHIYSDCFSATDKLIEEEYPKIIRRSQNKFNDPVGNFIITLLSKEGKIHVEQTFREDLIKIYTGRSALKLAKEIIADNPGILPDHAIYLGIELQKAQTALKGVIINYEQDK